MGVFADGQSGVESAALRRTEAVAKEKRAAQMRVQALKLEGKVSAETQVLQHTQPETSSSVLLSSLELSDTKVYEP